MDQWMFWVNIAVQVLVGVVLILVIINKNSLIKTLTSQFDAAKGMLQLYDVEQFRKYVDLKEETSQLEHQKEISKLKNYREEDVRKILETHTASWIHKYDELVNFELHYLLKLSDDKRDEYLKLLPKNREFLEKIIAEIKSGKMRPDN